MLRRRHHHGAVIVNDYLSADDLTALPPLLEDDVIIARGKVRVRGMSRLEVMAMDDLKAKGILADAAAGERFMLARVMILPKMTEAQIEQWQQEPAGGDMEAVTAKVAELSGLGKGAEKSGVAEPAGQPDLGIRILPGDQARDDSVPVTVTAQL